MRAIRTKLPCAVCGAALAGVASFVDVAGAPYCATCFSALRLEAADGAEVQPFACSICGHPNAVDEVVDRNGQLVCKACLAGGKNVNGNGASPAATSGAANATGRD